MPLVKAVQEQQEIIESQNAIIEDQKAIKEAQQKQIEELIVRLNSLEDE
jgi:uncharacterized coiled-coil protein SlyX